VAAIDLFPQVRILPIDQIRFVKELYPRLRQDDAAITRYRAALDRLPPIVIARDGVLVDGFHRWQAHLQEKATDIAVDDLGNLTDSEILRESIGRNAAHGQQLSQADKQRLAGELWLKHFAGMPAGERTAEIVALLSVSERSVRDWTKDARTAEREALQAQAWDLWLDCLNESQIAQDIGVSQPTVSRIIQDGKFAELNNPPESRQHFDIWQFQAADGDSSYFGRMPPQVVENLLWLYTEPGDIIVDPFAGGGTTIDVAKAMGRRIWASDLTPSNPLLPIHQHDIVAGWPTDAPRRAKLVLLDPPYWQQAKDRYSTGPDDLANMSLDEFYTAWKSIIKACRPHLSDDGRLAYVISPTQLDDGTVVDHATDMLATCQRAGFALERRIIVPYQTQQATGQQVNWARENKRLLKLYRDLVVLRYG
jgi:DNA modification methylase